MKPAGLLLSLQRPANGPYSEPGESNSHHKPYFPMIDYNINASIYTLVLQVVSSLQDIQTMLCTHFSSTPCAPHSSPIQPPFIS
jgi:hypothetical protein